MDPHLLIMRKSLVQKRAGERALCVCECVHLCIFWWVGGMCVCLWCADETVNAWKPGQGQRKGVTQHNPSGWCAHPVYLSAVSRPPLPPLIWMELIGPSTSLYGWLVCVFFHHRCWVPKKKQMCSFCYSLS